MCCSGIWHEILYHFTCTVLSWIPLQSCKKTLIVIWVTTCVHLCVPLNSSLLNLKFLAVSHYLKSANKPGSDKGTVINNRYERVMQSIALVRSPFNMKFSQETSLGQTQWTEPKPNPPQISWASRSTFFLLSSTYQHYNYKFDLIG